MPLRQPRPLWLWLCIAAGLGFLTLSMTQDEGLVSPLWWAELVLYVVMIAGLACGGFGLTVPAPMRAFVGLS
jgi:hypothetical protein